MVSASHFRAVSSASGCGGSSGVKSFSKGFKRVLLFLGSGFFFLFRRGWLLGSGFFRFLFGNFSAFSSLTGGCKHPQQEVWPFLFGWIGLFSSFFGGSGFFFWFAVTGGLLVQWSSHQYYQPIQPVRLNIISKLLFPMRQANNHNRKSTT